MPSSSISDRTISLVGEGVKFEILSGEAEILKASQLADGTKVLHGVASSTTRDLHGDVITLSGLQDMERTAVGLTAFLNHSYEIPKDVGGTITRAIIKQKGSDDDGNPNYQLEIDIEVEEENPAAVQTWKYIKRGRKLGLSIGAMIPKGGANRQKDGSYIIEHVLLLEVSMVGIPANPKSWIDYAASALRGMERRGTHNLGNPTLELNGDEYVIRGSMNDVKIDLSSDGQDRDFQFEYDEAVQQVRFIQNGQQVGAWDLSDDEQRVMAIATVGEDVVEKATVWVETRDGDKITIGEPVEDSVTDDGEPDIQKATCPDCGGSAASPRGSCGNQMHRDVEPDVADAKVRIIEVDTDDGQSSESDSQGASSSEPGDADATMAGPEPDIVAGIDPEHPLDEDELIRLSVVQLRDLALRATTQLVETTRALNEERAARIEAQHQRDEVITKTTELVKLANKTIQRVADAPLPRKGFIKELEASFSGAIERYYGADFARALRERN